MLHIKSIEKCLIKGGNSMWSYNCTSYSNELYHHGVKGQKWGVRRDRKQYRSTGIRAAMARRSNDKIDASFKNWNTNSKKRADAIELGKKSNLSKMAYENNRGDKSLKKQYKTDTKAYKKALRSNTTYRKGQIKKEVGSDLSRKYLSEAKKVKKQLNANPSDRQLQKKYNKLMSNHDVERARARKAPGVAARRSQAKANMKRTLKMTVKAAVVAGTVAAGKTAVNSYLSSHDVKFNGQDVRVTNEKIESFKRAYKMGKNFMSYCY